MSISTRPGRENIAAYAAACERLGMDVSPDLIYQSDHFECRAGRAAASRLLSAGAGAIMALGPMGVVAGVLEELDELGGGTFRRTCRSSGTTKTSWPLSNLHV